MSKNDTASGQQLVHRLTTIRADHSSVTFYHAFTNAKKHNVTKDTPIYAVFLSGLMKVSLPSSLYSYQ